MTRIILFLLIIISVAGCKKPNKTTPPKTTTATYDFSFASEPLVGVPSYADLHQFSFTTTAPLGSTTAWDFGDGFTSSDLSPHHIYHAVATYAVKLVINGDSAHALTKPLDVALYLPHSFSWSGATITESPLFFRSNVLQDSSFLWDFGDGTTSTDATPMHSYHSTGTYFVNLTINGHASLVVGSTLVINKDPIYTHLLAGTRSWHDTAYLYRSGLGTQAFPQPDRSFALWYINPVQIAYNGRSMYYIPSVSTDSMIYFGDSYTDNTGNTHSLNVEFYHFNDSIRMVRLDRISAGGSSGEVSISYKSGKTLLPKFVR